MLGTILVISSMVLGGVLIKDATTRAGETAKRKLGATASLELDFNAMGSGGGTGMAPQINADTVDSIGTSPLVEKHNYTSFNGARLLDGTTTASGKPIAPGMGGDHTLAHGVLDSSLLPDFSSGKWELLSGEPITAADKNTNALLVEERLAKKNQLKVGDSVTLGENDPEGKRQADFTVKGIYRDPSDEPDPEYQQFPGDRLFVPAAALSKLNSGDKDAPVQVSGATFQLRNPETFDTFNTEAKKTAGSALDGFKISINDKAVQQMTGPLQSISSSANAAMWLIGIAGAIVLGLLTTLAVKQRRSEFGILLAMGEKKWKLVAQQMVEIVVVAAIAVTLSAAFAQTLTQKASDALLSSEADAAHRQIDAWQPPPPGSTGLNEGIDYNDEPAKDADPIDKITVRLEPAALGRVAGVGLGISLMAAAIPATSVVRLNPRTILTKGK